MNGPSKSKETARPDRPLSVIPSGRPETKSLQDDQRPDGKEPRESIFGPGAAPFLAQLIISVGALGFCFSVLLLANSVKEKASRWRPASRR